MKNKKSMAKAEQAKHSLTIAKTLTEQLSDADNRLRWQQNPPKEFPSPWASEWGFDEYGLWQSFSIKGIRCKMRFICAGSFLMGSPDDEPERQDNESQHKVTLSQGYWLAETTVSQTLWSVVMDNNPSHLKQPDVATQGPDRGIDHANLDQQNLPVENISWHDCQDFCQKINSLIPGLTLSIPSEAQWEYACRAGTQTPFSTGHALSTDQANYHGKYPYNKDVKGELRAKAMPVDAFEPNAWGLKQMHGNVWEWCLDAIRDYPVKTQEQAFLDPTGKLESSKSVLRGGGFFNGGRYCRSAYRDQSSRVNAVRGIGLRVSQVEQANR